MTLTVRRALNIPYANCPKKTNGGRGRGSLPQVARKGLQSFKPFAPGSIRLLQCIGTVGYAVLHVGGQLSKGLWLAVRNKQRIIAESIRSPLLFYNTSGAFARDGLYTAGGVGQRDHRSKNGPIGRIFRPAR